MSLQPVTSKVRVGSTNYNLRSKSGDNMSIITSEPSTLNEAGLFKTINTETPSNKDIMMVLRCMNDKLGKLDTIEDELKALKVDLATTVTNVDNIDVRVKVLEEEKESNLNAYNNALKKQQISALINEYNSKEYNIIINNLPGIGKKEKPSISLAKVYSVLKDILRIEDADAIVIANCHRLPGKDSKRLPLIFKLASMFDKDKIWKNLNNLSIYNNDQDDDHKVFIQMNHLPKKLKDDRDELLGDFLKHKKAGKKPRWRFVKDKGEYCYMIGKNVYRPQNNNFIEIE